jgi:predicted metal-dependent peptidase
MAGRHSARASRALRKLSETDPAFASLALWVVHEDSDARPLPAWSDGTTIRYGPSFETLTLPEQMGLAAHHILHVAFRHAARGASLALRFGPAHDDVLFNAASDAVLNEAIFRAGYILPRPCVLLTDILSQSLGETAQTDDALARWDAERLYIRLMSETGKAGRPSPADAARDWAKAQGFSPDLESAAAEDGSDDVGEWHQRIARAMEAGRLAGRGIGMIGHRLADLPEARTPWETILRAHVSKAVTDLPRRSWHRPTGRWLALDAAGKPAPFEPAPGRTRRAPRIAVGIDSSGSIDGTRLSLFAAQITGIARRTGAETHVLVFDDGIRDRRVLKAGAWDRAMTDLAFSRDGGTDFNEVLREADALDPAVIVMLTDLDAPVPSAPRAPVIWAVPEDPVSQPPFGRVLSLAR